MSSILKSQTAKDKPGIIYAWDYLQWGGAQIHFFALIKEVKRDFNVKIVMPEKSDAQLLKFVTALDVPYELIPTHSDASPANTVLEKIRRHFVKFQTERAFLKELNKQDLANSILHVDLAPWQSLFSLIRLSLKTKVFVTAHNSLPPVPAWRRLLWRVKAATIASFSNFHLFCSNEESKTYFAGLFPKSFEPRIKVTYTGINPVEIDSVLALEFSADELKHRFDIPNDKFLVLCVGQFIDRKGRWTFLEAAHEIELHHDDFVFVWISNSRPTSEEIDRAEDYGLGDRFRLIISDEVGSERMDLLKMFRLADVFTLPSFVEGLPISLLEAMALGIPSISTNINAIPEAVLDMQTGILIEAGDSEALARSIVALKIDPELSLRLSRDGREYVLQHFDERVVAAIAMESYRQSLIK